MTQHLNRSRMAGFTLFEVMIALIIISVGLLGIAKMQALTLSTTASSGTRSLVAIETASFASSMHTNRDYWVTSPPASFTVAVQTTGPGTNTVTITDSTNTLNTGANCATTATCTAAQVAAYDVSQWGAALASGVPAALATVTCNTTFTGTPVSCTIQITWQENVTSLNNTTAAASSAAGVLNSPQYTLYVEP